MSKKNKTLLIVSISFILLGSLIFVGTMSFLNWDFMKLNTTQYEKGTHTVSDEFSNITINVDIADISFLKSNNQSCTVEYIQETKVKYMITVEEETLKIDIEDTRKIYDHIYFFNFGTPKIKVHLPKEKYDSLVVNASTGDIEIPKEFMFDNVNIKASTSDIKCKASVTNDLKISLSTGETKLENITAGNIELKASSGDTCLTNVNCKSLLSSADTGDIKLENVDAGSVLSLTRSTGDVLFDRCDADEILIKTDTGDVEGSLLTSKIFDCKTDTGEISLPDTIEGGKCEITTDTGDIKIEIGK